MSFKIKLRTTGAHLSYANLVCNQNLLNDRKVKNTFNFSIAHVFFRKLNFSI